jgi:serine/threonine protein kinase
VKLARENGTGLMSAMKVIKKPTLIEKELEALKKFEKELNALLSLSHKNIIKLNHYIPDAIVIKQDR